MKGEEMKHTPGPWNKAYIYDCLRFGYKNPMALGYEDDDESHIFNKPTHDDAAFIAAAPDMHRVLNHMLRNAIHPPGFLDNLYGEGFEADARNALKLAEEGR